MGDPAKVEVKATGDAAVVPQPPPQPKSPPPEPKKEDPAPVPSPDGNPILEYNLARIRLNGLYNGTWMGNKARDPNSDDPESNIDPYTGGGFMAELCYPQVNFTRDGVWSMCPTLNYKLNKSSTGNLAQKGPEVKGSVTTQKLALGANLYWHPLSWLGVYAGFNFGALHIGSKAPEDGESGTDGAFVGDGDKPLALKVSYDDWMFSPGVQAGIRFPLLQAGGVFAAAPELGVAVDWFAHGKKPDWFSEADRKIEVPAHQVMFTAGFSFDVGPGVQRYDRAPLKIGGDAEKAPAAAPEPKKEEKKVDPAPPPAAPLPESVTAVQALVEPVKTDVKAALDKKAGENTAAHLKIVNDSNEIVKASDSPKKAKEDARGVAKDAAKEAVKTADAAAADYQKALNKRAEAEAKLAVIEADQSVDETGKKAAREAAATIKTEVEKLQADAYAAWENARDAVKTYNGIAGVGKKDQLAFKSPDPTTFKGVAPKVDAPPAAPAKKDEKKEGGDKPTGGIQ